MSANIRQLDVRLWFAWNIHERHDSMHILVKNFIQLQWKWLYYSCFCTWCINSDVKFCFQLFLFNPSSAISLPVSQIALYMFQHIELKWWNAKYLISHNRFYIMIYLVFHTFELNHFMPFNNWRRFRFGKNRWHSFKFPLRTDAWVT